MSRSLTAPWLTFDASRPEWLVRRVLGSARTPRARDTEPQSARRLLDRNASSQRTVTMSLMPAFPSIATSESTLKRPILPRVKSEILGCVTPSSCAASDCVSLRAAMCSRSSIMSWDRNRRFSASAGSKPRSAKTLSLPLWIPRGRDLRAGTTRDDFAVPLRAEFAVKPRRAARALPECVEDIDAFLKFDDVQQPKSATGADTKRMDAIANPRHCLEVRGLQAALNEFKLISSTSARSDWEPFEIVLRRAHPEYLLPAHGVYTYLYKASSALRGGTDRVDGTARASRHRHGMTREPAALRIARAVA